MKHKAIYNLYPNVTTIRGNIAYDSNDNVVEINEDDVNNWTDPEQYKYERKNEYPEIGDQLDDLFHAGAFSTEMTAIIQAVKDKYPKE